MLNMFIRNCWYVAAWSHEIGDGIFSRTLLGEPVCFFRDQSGKVVALLDRCAHRSAPLSMGRLENGAVRCLYHGVKFAASGACIEIPGQERIPTSMCVRHFPVVERNQWVWIWMGDPAAARTEDIPNTWSLDHPQWTYKPGYYHYSAPHMLICDNLLDFSHIGYVHPTTLGGTESIALSKPVVKPCDQGVRVERWLLDEVPAPFHTKVADFSGRVDRWHFYDFLIPGILIMHSGVQATGTGAPEGRYINAFEFRSCQAVTPETTATAHYFYAVPRNFAQHDNAMTETIFADVVAAFEEDRVMIEAQAKRLAAQPDASMVAIIADAGVMQFRRLLATRLQTEQQPAHESITDS